MILAGDIGGTNTRLAGFRLAGGRPEPLFERIYPSQRYRSLEEVISEFRAEHHGPVEVACFGLAGPVRGGRSETTNLAWVVDTAALQALLGIREVFLINDLEANAYGIAALDEQDWLVLHPGYQPAVGNGAIIAAGTGLGEAGLFWDGVRHHPFATEGGHSDFAPQDRLQFELAAWLARQFGRVSWERVLSGPGLADIYRFLSSREPGHEDAAIAEAIAGAADPAAAVSAAALTGTSRFAAAALDLFVELYGAEAGNLALKLMATGGVWVGGGIAPKILPALLGGRFVAAFTAKGRMSPLVEAMPVRVILNDRTALLGAARCAALRYGRLDG